MQVKLQPGLKIDDKYVLESELGSGANGTVFLALEEQLGRRVAIKFLKQGSAPIGRARFEREARALSMLTHANIIHIYRFGFMPDDTPFIVMEFADGRSLRSIIEERKSLPCGEAVEIAMQIAAALEFAHSQQIVHRDLKPENIMINESLSGITAKILDFGLCKQENNTNQQASLTETGLILGTVLYMSPEQCLGKESDNRSDIYSFGCILFEMITGGPPFVSESAASVVLKHISEPMPKILHLSPSSGLPEELQDLILKCSAKAKDERYQNFTELKSALASVRGISPNARFKISEANSLPLFLVMKRIPKKYIQSLALVLLTLALASVGYLAFSDSGNTILAKQIQLTLPAGDAIKTLKQIVEIELKFQHKNAAASIVAETTNSKTYSFWTITDREELLGTYINLYEEAGMPAQVFELRLQLLAMALDHVSSKKTDLIHKVKLERKGDEQRELISSLVKILLKTKLGSTPEDIKKWKELYFVLEKRAGFLEGHRSPIYCFLSALRAEAMLHLESTFSYPGLHTLAEECYFTAEAAYLAGEDEMVRHYSAECFRIGKKIELVSVIHRMHVVMGMYAIKNRNVEEARRQLRLAIESGKELLLSTANTQRLECLAYCCNEGKYLTLEQYSREHPKGPRAHNPLMEFLGVDKEAFKDLGKDKQED